MKEKKKKFAHWNILEDETIICAFLNSSIVRLFDRNIIRKNRLGR